MHWIIQPIYSPPVRRDYTKSEYCILTSSGTSALVAILKSYRFPSGSEILIPCYACPQVALSVIYSGLTPILCDVRLNDFHIDPELLESKISRKTKAIIAIHTFAQTYPQNSLKKVCKKYDLEIIEDACQSFGSEHNGRPHGSIEKVGLTSFGIMKIVSIAEGGGAIFTNEKLIYDRIKKIVVNWDIYGNKIELSKIMEILVSRIMLRFKKHIGIDLHHLIPSFFKFLYKFDNSVVEQKMSEKQAGDILFELQTLDQKIKDRVTKAKLYDILIKNPGLLDKHYVKSNNQLFYSCLVKDSNRDYLIKELEKSGVGNKSYSRYKIHTPYDRPLSLFFNQGKFSITEKISSRIITFDISEIADVRSIKYISSQINSVKVRVPYNSEMVEK